VVGGGRARYPSCPATPIPRACGGMSDFLHRLARRTLSPEQLVRPRLASLFERVDAPLPPAAAITEEESFEQTFELDAPRRRPPGPTPAAAHQPEADAQQSPSGPPAPRPAALPEPPRPARSVDPGVVSVPVPRRRPSARPLRHEPVPRRALPTRSHPAVVPEFAGAEPPAAQLSDPVPPVAGASDSDERSVVRAPAVVEQLTETPARSTPPVAIEVRTRADRPTRREQRIARRLPQPGPAVHVSIGRVEVRAIATPAAPRERTPEAPRGKQLDEYLRERDRGAR
jgi:hypothetical protein